MSNGPKMEANNRVAKLDQEPKHVNNVIGNPAFPHISQKILQLLNTKSQIAFRLVCQSWKLQVDQPFFWIKKLDCTKIVYDAWIDFLGRIDETSKLNEEVTNSLMEYVLKLNNSPEEAIPIYVAIVTERIMVAKFFASYTDNFDNLNFDVAYLLNIAASKGNIEMFELVASRVKNPNKPDPLGITPLQHAASNGYTEIFKFLAPQVENPNEPNLGELQTPLQLAAHYGHTEIFKFLAPQVKNPNEPTPNGFTPLQLAASRGHTEIFKFLAPQVENANASLPNGCTPLHIAAQQGRTEIFKFLAPQVKNPNAPDPDGWTPLQSAAHFGSTEIFKFLASQVENPNAPYPSGLTPLQIATNNNHTEIVDVLSQMLAN